MPANLSPEYKEAQEVQLQLLDLPPVAEDYLEPWMPGTLHTDTFRELAPDPFISLLVTMGMGGRGAAFHPAKRVPARPAGGVA